MGPSGSPYARRRRGRAEDGALPTEPTLLVADEPTAALDSVTGAAIISLLRAPAISLLRALAESGVGVLVATRDEQVVELCDTVHQFHDSHLLAPVPATADSTAGP